MTTDEVLEHRSYTCIDCLWFELALASATVCDAEEVRGWFAEHIRACHLHDAPALFWESWPKLLPMGSGKAGLN